MRVRHVLVVWVVGWLAAGGMAQSLPVDFGIGQPATAPAATAPASPKEVLQQLNVAMQTGDAESIRALLWAQNDEEQQLIEAVIDLSQAIVKLRQAATQAFGQDGARPLVGQPDVEQSNAAIAAATQEVGADIATVDLGVGRQVFLIKQEGHWRVPIAMVTEGLTEVNVAQRTQEIRLRAQLFRETADEIADGRHKDAEAAAEALRTRVMRPAVTQPADATTQPAGE